MELAEASVLYIEYIDNLQLKKKKVYRLRDLFKGFVKLD